MFSLLSSCLLFLSCSLAEALSPISVKGVSYITPQGDSDPLVDAKQCQTDAALMKKAGINTVYVYTVDSEQDHDGCMNAFADQGIYVWLQLGDFPRVTDPTQDTPQWTLSLFAAWTAALDAFAGYDNTLAFGIAQEIITENSTSTKSAPSLKAAARDLRAFRTARGYRPIPLAYSAADVPALRLLTAQYLTCGDASTAGIDLLGLNIFHAESCSTAAWSALREQLRDLPLSVPVVISEAGCVPASFVEDGVRDFKDDAARLLGEGAYREVFSGVNVFEWAVRGDSGFGVVQYPPSGAGEPSALAQFDALSSVFVAAASVTGTPSGEYTPSSTAIVCPTLDAAKGWLVDGAVALPSIEGLRIGTVTVRTTVTAGDAEGGPTGEGGRVDGDGDGGGAGGLSTGAIAGMSVGSVIGVLAFVTGVFMCLRRRRRAAPHGDESLEGAGSMEILKRSSYTYPAGKVPLELPAQNMATAEMDASGHLVSTSTTGWKTPIPGREDSPTVTELPDGQWRQAAPHELEDNHTDAMVAGTQTRI
ncbi:Glucanosyltransferase-domain-containing protein [Parachaetomium inaequale]|uniref:1,3-beta-glucanosyltransferase n=1 Tax=Parachaetomium inaequale TaxID=2588326 RepID=A0AAN6P9M8_9PEZI|nr:Glucanosyltransferase-domain-containing protein [Parachaetomium inaequale]